MKHDPLEKRTRIPFKVAGSKLVHFYDGAPINELREGTIGDIIVNDFAVGDQSRVKQYNAEREVVFLLKDTQILARISPQSIPPKLREWLIEGKKFIGASAIEIILREDLRLRLRGTKEAQLLPCPCVVPALAEIAETEELPASVNQAYTLISRYFEPHRRSHTGNIFDCVFYRPEQIDIWQPLRHLRDQLQADHEATIVATKPASEPSKSLLTPMPEPAGLAEAIALAAVAHVNQKDKAGAPYIRHPLRMMQRLRTDDERTAAVLHDVVEDTDLTLDDLRQRGFKESVVSAVEALTKRDGEAYEQFIERARQHRVARQVKLADIEDNLDLLRLTELTEKDVERLRKYHQARRRLLDLP